MEENKAEVSQNTTEAVTQTHAQAAADAAAEAYAQKLRDLGYETTGEPQGVILSG